MVELVVVETTNTYRTRLVQPGGINTGVVPVSKYVAEIVHRERQVLCVESAGKNHVTILP